MESSSSSLSRSPSISNSPSLSRQSSADEIFAKLINMGFDIEQSTSAVRVSLAQVAQGQQGITLLEAALQYLLATSDSETRAVLYSPTQSPQPSKPPPASIKPAKGILKPSNSPPAIRATTNFIFKRDWLVKQVDTATSVLSATLGRIKTQAAGASASSNNNNNVIGSLTSLFGSPLSESQLLTSTNETPNMSHQSPATSLSSTSLSPINPSPLPPDPDSQKHSRESSERNEYSLPRHVRFSFPDITILPENICSEDAVYPGYEAEDPSDLVFGSHSSVPLSVNAVDSLVGQQAGASMTVEHTGAQGTRMRDVTNRYDADELLLFYQQATTKRFEPILDKLANELSISGYVTKLDLSGSIIDKRNVASIAELLTEVVGLQQLNLANCNLEDESLKMLLHAILYRNELPWVSLADNKRLRGNGVKYIAVFIKKAKALKYLDVSGLTIDRKSLAYINHALTPSASQPMGPTLKVIKLENCRLRGSILDMLIPGVRRSRLSHLSLRDNKTAWEAGQSVADMLIPDDEGLPEAGMLSNDDNSRRGLKSLDLRGNDLRNGIAPICAALNENNTLRELDLRDNKIDGPGLDIISFMLKKNSGLSVLDLSGNAIGTDMEGIIALKKALSQNHHLIELYLANTRLETEGAIALAEALPLCTKLQKLDVTYNPIDLAGILGLATSLKHNQSLLSLDIVPVLENPGIQPGEETLEFQRLLKEVKEVTTRNMEFLAKRQMQVTKVDGQSDNSELPSQTIETPPGPKHLQHRRGVIGPLHLGKDIATSEETAGVLIDMVNKSKDSTSTDMLDQSELMRQLYVECQRMMDRLSPVLNDVVDETWVNQLLTVNEKLLNAMRVYEANVGVKSPSSPSRKTNSSFISIPTRGPSSPVANSLLSQQNGNIHHSDCHEEQVVMEKGAMDDADLVVSECLTDLGPSTTTKDPIGNEAFENVNLSDHDLAL